MTIVNEMPLRHNTSTVNVNKTKLMLSGSKTMESSFNDSTLSTDKEQVNLVSSLHYLGVAMGEYSRPL